MFCKNCGNEMDPAAAVCVKCGAPKGVGSSFCPNCGAPTAPNSAVCLNCGCALGVSAPDSEQKSKMVAGLLAIFLGCFGAHNFYLGFTGKAIAQLLLSFVCGIGYIWSLVEGIMIFTGSINTDAKGVPLKE